VTALTNKGDRDRSATAEDGAQQHQQQFLFRQLIGRQGNNDETHDYTQAYRQRRPQADGARVAVQDRQPAHRTENNHGNQPVQIRHKTQQARQCPALTSGTATDEGQSALRRVGAGSPQCQGAHQTPCMGQVEGPAQKKVEGYGDDDGDNTCLHQRR
jgi:hypothetical protein